MPLDTIQGQGQGQGQGLLGEDRVLSTSDGRRIRTMVRGDANDLVVLEAGLGFSGLYWGFVHESLAARTRAVAYERAGFGGSIPIVAHGLLPGSQLTSIR